MIYIKTFVNKKGERLPQKMFTKACEQRGFDPKAVKDALEDQGYKFMEQNSILSLDAQIMFERLTSQTLFES